MSGLTRYGYLALSSNTTGDNNSAFGNYAAYYNTDASCNTAVGSNALFNNTIAPHNTAIGAGSMFYNTTGQLNTAVGSSALEGSGTAAASVGNQNVAIGAQALYDNSGDYNVGVGCFALQNNSTGGPNTAVGYSALQANTTGPNNTAIGYLALALNDASYNTAVGSGALANNTTGHYNTAVGTALVANDSGILNTATGFRALLNNTTGYYNTAVGSYALFYNRDGSGNTAVGFEAGIDLSGNSDFNTFLGNNTHVSSPTLTYNSSTAIGYQATIDASNQIVLGTSAEHVKIPGTYVGIGGVYNINETPNEYNLDVSGNINFSGLLLQNGSIYPTPTANYWTTDGTDISNNNTGNVGIGCTPNSSYALDVSGALQTTADALINGLTVGHGGGNNVSNTAVGVASLENNTGSNNTAIGNVSLKNNTTGSINTATGDVSLYNNTTGSINTATGYGSLFKNTTGSNNTANGYGSLRNNTIGNFNTANGFSSLFNNTTGNYNTAIGGSSGASDISGNYNTFLGYQADVSSNTLIYKNSTALGYQAIIDASNQMVLGTATEKVKIPGTYVGIGGVYNPSSSYALDVSGNTNSYYIDLSSQGNYTGNPWGVVPKKYIDDRVQGLIPLAACQCATDASVNLLAAPVSPIDGYPVQTGDRVLVNYQSGTTPNVANTANGIYVVNLAGPTYWTYASDWTGDTYRCTVNVLSGVQNGNKQFIQIQNPGTVPTDPILFEIFSSSDQAGRGLSTEFLGTTLYLNVDTSLNFVNYLDNSAGPDNINVLNLGTNTNNIYIGKVSDGNNKISVTTNSVGINNNNPSSSYALDVSGALQTTSDALINGLTFGSGSGSGGNSTAVGYQALYNNTTGTANTAIGQTSLQNNTIGTNNTALGGGSLRYAVSTSNNTAIGFASLYNNAGNDNTSIGNYSLFNNTGTQNTAIGDGSGFSLVNGNFNTFLGAYSNFDISSNIYTKSTALGYGATIDASNQMVLGTATEKVKIPGTYVGIGGIYNPSSSYALDVSGNINFTGDLYKSGTIYPTPTANYWTTDGTDISNNNTGSVGIGCTPSYALDVSGNLNTSADAYINGIIVGLGGGNVSTNTAIGTDALQANTGGQLNTAVGFEALLNNTSGINNTALGYQALYNNIGNTSGGSDNTAIGLQALYLNVEGAYNTAVGLEAGHDLSGNSNYNTFLGSLTDVSSNTLIYNYSTALGYNATIDASNQIVLGTATEKVKIPGTYVGIGGVYDPLSGFNLDVSGVLQVQDGTVDSFASLHGLKVSPSEFFYNSKTPTNTSSFKIELEGANCLIYKGVGSFVGSATVIQNSGTAGGIALASTTTGIYVNESGSVPGVGIMTTNPLYTLDVSGNMRTTADALINTLTVGRGGGNNVTNTAVGVSSLVNNITGQLNTANGYASLLNNIDGSNNTANGYNSLLNNTTGSNNTANGYGSLLNNTTGSNNTANGYGSLLNNKGSNNTANGVSAGFDLSGNCNYNTFLGYQADVSSNTLIYNNSTAIGYQATIDASNQIVLGTATESVYIPGTYVCIGGAYNPLSGPALDVSGNLFISQASFGNLYQNQIGYTLSTTSTTPEIAPGTEVTLCSVTIPKGVWIVEGSLEATISGAEFYSLSLSTSTSFDDSRKIVRYITTNSIIWSDHITSVFVLSISTTINLLGSTGPSGVSSANSNVITYTKIG
jgi:hypothetical protein